MYPLRKLESPEGFHGPRGRLDLPEPNIFEKIPLQQVDSKP